jgi:chlorite dismutase
MSEGGLSKVKVREINETIRYTAWSVFKVKEAGVDLKDRQDLAQKIALLLEDWAKRDISLRGIYNVSALRADADFMFWTHAKGAEDIQDALHEFALTGLGTRSELVWSAMGLHRPAEFNKGHVPAFMTGAAPKEWAVIYPFVRSYEWYLLPEEERRAMLVEHGIAGRDFSGILSNTVSAFALGDYEWILALESDELHEMVDMMRELRSTQARRHVRVEIPFYTGHLISNDELTELFA